MKKILSLILVLVLLMSCSQNTESVPSTHEITFDEATITTYTIGRDEEEVYESGLLEASSTDQTSLVYSLNPLFDLEETTPVYTENFYRISELDSEDKDEMFWIGYYGLELYNASGDIDYYFAAQELLWELQENEEGEPFDIFFTQDLEAHKSSISRQVTMTNDSQPRFEGSVITVTESDLEEQRVYEITELSNNLELYDLVLPDQLELIGIEESVMSIKILDYTDNLAIRFVRKSILSDVDSLEYLNEEGAHFLSLGHSRLSRLATELHFEMDDTLMGTTLTINNISSSDINTLLYGGEFEIAEDEDFTRNVVSSQESTDGVSAKFEHLPPTKLYLRQITAPEGYDVNESIHEFSLSQGSSKVSITFINEPEVIVEEAE